MPMPQLVFLGDSLIEFYDWRTRFPGYHVTNLGIAGETVHGLRGRLDRIAGHLPIPDWFLVMIGTNNLAMEEYGFLPDYREIVASLRHRYPAAAIQVTSLLPLQLPWLAAETIPRLNDRLCAMAQELGAGYVDAHGAFRENRQQEPLFLADGVHLSEAGYTVWADAITPFLP